MRTSTESIQGVNDCEEHIAPVVPPKAHHDEDIVIEHNREVIAQEATRHGEEVGIWGLLRELNTVSYSPGPDISSA